MIEHFEKGYSPSALQRKYKLTYEQARELADKLQEIITWNKEYKIREKNYGDSYEALEKENKQLRQQLDIAIKSINSAAGYLACMDDLSELTGKCNEQMALEELNKAIEQIEELKK